MRDTVAKLARLVASQGDSTRTDDSFIFEKSELTLVARPKDEKLVTDSILFPFIGLDFQADADGNVSVLDVEGDAVESFAVDSEALTDAITKHLEARIELLETQQL